MNIPQALAIQLSSSASRSLEERLFEKALDKVVQEARKANEKSTFFDKLQHARTLDDLQLALNSSQKSNKFWSEDVGKSWFKNLSKFAECMLVYKGLVDAITSKIGPDLVSPVLGAISFVLGVLKDIPSVSSKLKDVEQELEYSAERFSRYLKYGDDKISSSFQSALVVYYETVISFAMQTHREFEASRTRSAFNTVHKTLDSKLTVVKDKIKLVIDHVDKAGVLDRFEVIDGKLNHFSAAVGLAVLQQASGRSSPQPSATRTIHNLRMQNQYFSGRRTYLHSIWKALHDQKFGINSAAVYGLGGIGKTQLVQKYAYDQIQQSRRQVVIYINASDPATISADVLSFMQIYAAQFLISTSSDPKSYSQLHAWLANQEDWLLVLDNVQDFDDIRNIVPRGNHQGQVLCSTRQKALAELFASNNVIEVLPMTSDESRELVDKLVRPSTFEDDKSSETCREVVNFAKGVPILIEQLIRNALFSKRSIRETLLQVAAKEGLLRQKNISSFHEENISLGGVVMQAFESIKAKSDKAEALFSILAYLEPSAIPVQLLREGSREYQSFLTKTVTYDRGARRVMNGRAYTPVEHKPHMQVATASSMRHRALTRIRAWSKFVREDDLVTQLDLPVDDQEVRKALNAACGSNTPIGRLFENKDIMDDALLTLRNAAVVRDTAPGMLQMHDLVSEIARALIESKVQHSSNHSLLTASIMVYLSFPHPETLYMSNVLQGSKRHLPHALSCHRELKSAGILNDFAIGPELSHLIASTLANNLTRDFKESGEHRSLQEVKPFDETIVNFYLQAYDGYMAGWERLKQLPSVTDQRIIRSTIRDRDKEVVMNCLFQGREYSQQMNRFGSSSPWRAIQTAARLHVYLEQKAERYAEAQEWLQIVLNFYTKAFGPLDQETHYFRSCMISLLGSRRGDFESAYNINLTSIAILLDCKTSRPGIDFLRGSDFTIVLHNMHGLDLIATAGSCALNHSRICRDNNDRENKIRWAETALFWFELRLKESRAFYRDAIYVLSSEMKDLAHAYELCEKPRTSMYHFAQVIVCTFDTTGPLAEECGAPPSVKFDNIQIYESAKARLYDTAQTTDSITAWNGDMELTELIDSCDKKVNFWKESYVPPEPMHRKAVDWDLILEVDHEDEVPDFKLHAKGKENIEPQ